MKEHSLSFPLGVPLDHSSSLNYIRYTYTIEIFVWHMGKQTRQLAARGHQTKPAVFPDLPDLVTLKNEEFDVLTHL